MYEITTPGSPNLAQNNCVYPFGLDIAWYMSVDALTFTNNIKMKLSVIIAVAHMTIGVIVKGLNSIYKGQWIVFVFEVCAGVIILLGLFGWMDLLIYAKWIYPTAAYTTNPDQIAW